MGDLIIGLLVAIIITNIDSKETLYICLFVGFIVLCIAISRQISNAEKKEQERQAKKQMKEQLKEQRKQRAKEYVIKHYRDGQSLLKQIDTIVVQTILEHLQTLDVKYQQSIYKDDYGCIVEDSWLKEIEYFVNKVLSPILATKITNKKKCFALQCSIPRIKFLFPRNFTWNGIKDYKTLIDIEFLDKTQNVIIFDKQLLESYSLNDGYVDFIYLLGNDILNLLKKDKTALETINATKTILEKLDGKEISVEEMTQRMEPIISFLKNNNPQYDKEYINEEYPNNIYFISYDTQCNTEALTQMVHSIYKSIKSYIKTPQELDTSHMSPYDFEKECARILNLKGFSARATKGSGDQGVDVLAEKNNIKIAIQCKQYSKPVGNKAVQEVIAGKNFYNTEYAAVVSNASFTPSARKLAAKCGVILLDIRTLNNLEEYLNKEESMSK